MANTTIDLKDLRNKRNQLAENKAKTQFDFDGLLAQIFNKILAADTITLETNEENKDSLNEDILALNMHYEAAIKA